MALHRLCGRDFMVRVVPSGEKIYSKGIEVDAELNRGTRMLRVSGNLSRQAVADLTTELTIEMCMTSVFKVRRETARRKRLLKLSQR